MGLLINADDFGMSASVNEAIDVCINNNWIQRTTLMVNMPQTEEAVNLARQSKYVDRVGLHINLVEGLPLTHKIRQTSLCNETGAFNGLFFKKLIHRFYLKKREREVVEEEIEAQIKRYIGYGFKAMHLDSHQHSHVNASVFFIVVKLALKYNFKSLRLSRNLPVNEITGLKNIYKKLINHKIIKFNNEHCYGGNKYQYFGSKRDCEKEGIGNNMKNKQFVVEMMVHPTMCNGKIVDSCTNESLFQ